MKKISKNLKDTERIAQEFLQKLYQEEKKYARVICLQGNLGAGKTAFVKAVGRILGIKSIVNSPTFVIIKRHLPRRGPHKTLFHIDAYRLKNERDLKILGWEEILKDKENIIFIEWPERVRKIMPRHAHKIKISHKNFGHREFEIGV